jgi:hypothetical protein
LNREFVGRPARVLRTQAIALEHHRIPLYRKRHRLQAIDGSVLALAGLKAEFPPMAWTDENIVFNFARGKRPERMRAHVFECVNLSI